jgi:hypothetical protein
MTFKVSTRVRIKGKNVVVQRTADSEDRSATLEAIRAVGEDARRLRKANDAAIKSTRQAFRRKKTARNA